MDTDGNFQSLIPNFLDTGIDGFLPMDVNAGMDIVQTRKEFPLVKFIGGFNKNLIEKGEKSIDQEFERLLPVIRQGGYIPACDHQVPPTASLNNYQYYIERLFAVMEENGRDIK